MLFRDYVRLHNEIETIVSLLRTNTRIDGVSLINGYSILITTKGNSITGYAAIEDKTKKVIYVENKDIYAFVDRIAKEIGNDWWRTQAE